MNALVAGLLTSTMLVSAPGFQQGDCVFPKDLPGQLRVGNRVAAEVTILDYLVVLQVKGGWLWVESHDLISDEPGTKGWILAEDVDDIGTEIDYLAELTTNDPQSSEAWVILGLTQNLAGYPKDAITAVTRAISIEPANEFYYFLRGQLWIGIRQYQKALEDFTQAASLIAGDETYAQMVVTAQQLVDSHKVPDAPPEAKPPAKDTTVRLHKVHKTPGVQAMSMGAKKLTKQKKNASP